MDNVITDNTYLGEGKISRLLFKFSVPCIVSLLISALYNLVDQIFIGNSELGYLGNAATGVVFPVLIVTQAFAWCFGDGTAAYISLCQGRRDSSSAHKCVGGAVTVTLAISAALAVLFGIFKTPVLTILGASEQTMGMAADYMVILLYFFPAYMLTNMLSSVIRADGSPAYSMAATSAGAVVNIILDPIFIFALKWGIEGAAWATVIGQTVSFILCAVYFFRSKTFRLKLKSFLPDFKILLNAVKLGSSTFITQTAIVVIALACNVLLAFYGRQSIYGPDIPISVISIETKVFTIIINIVVGIVLGGQPILGFNYGAAKYGRVKEAYKKILTATLTVGIVSTLVVEIFPRAVISVFGAGDELYFEFAEKTFRIFLSMVTLTCFVKMTSIFFQAVGQPVKAAASSLIRDLLCFVPLAFILPEFMGIDGVLYAAPIADVIAAAIAVTLSVVFFKKLKKQEKELLNKKQACDIPAD